MTVPLAQLTSFKRRVRAGTRLRCVENTYRPRLVGTVRVITDPGLDGSRVVTYMVDSGMFTMRWPLPRHVESITESEIRFYLEDRPGHMVTLQIDQQS